MDTLFPTAFNSEGERVDIDSEEVFAVRLTSVDELDRLLVHIQETTADLLNSLLEDDVSR